jgi:hypothetical protein
MHWHRHTPGTAVTAHHSVKRSMTVTFLYNMFSVYLLKMCLIWRYGSHQLLFHPVKQPTNVSHLNCRCQTTQLTITWLHWRRLSAPVQFFITCCCTFASIHQQTVKSWSKLCINRRVNLNANAYPSFFGVFRLSLLDASFVRTHAAFRKNDIYVSRIQINGSNKISYRNSNWQNQHLTIKTGYLYLFVAIYVGWILVLHHRKKH